MLQFFIVAFIIFIIAFQVNHFHSSVTNAPNTAPARMEKTASPFKFHQVKIPQQAGLENDKCQLDPVSLCEKQIKDREISLNNNCNKIAFRKHFF